MKRENYFVTAVAGRGVPAHFTEGMEDFYRLLYRYYDLQRERYATETSLAGARFSPALDGVVIQSLARGLRPLCDCVGGRTGSPLCESLAGAVEKEPALVSRWLEAVLSRESDRIESLGAEHKGGVDETYFIIMNWLKPFMAHWRSLVPMEETDEVSEFCPFCGMFPDMSILMKEKEGKRFLHCALCEGWWPYPRLRCFHCGTDDQDMLGYLADEGQAGRRVDCCDGCGAYIKTLVLERFTAIDETDLVVENVLSGDLDSAALERGYGRP